MRHDPVARRQHLPTYFGIARFIRLPEQAAIDRNNIVERDKCGESQIIAYRFHHEALAACWHPANLHGQGCAHVQFAPTAETQAMSAAVRLEDKR